MAYGKNTKKEYFGYPIWWYPWLKEIQKKLKIPKYTQLLCHALKELLIKHNYKP